MKLLPLLFGICLTLSGIATASAQTLVDLTVKEVAGVGGEQVVSAVIPLPYGHYQALDELHIEDDKGQLVPAQFEVLNRWWARDNSIRHALVHFPAKVSAYTKPHSGLAHYHLIAQAQPVSVPNPVQIQPSGKNVQITNGLIQLHIDTQQGHITTPAGPLEVALITPDGQFKSSLSRKDMQVVVEEQGPVRAVVKLSAPTLYQGDGHVLYGWAMRIYAYANSRVVKVDYQLQNSAINQVFSAPLYFQGVELSLATDTPTEPRQLRAYDLQSDVYQKPFGTLGNAKASIYVRDFWQAWPNGVRVEADGRLVAELWPRWSRQFNNGRYADLNLYWLDDMRQVVKEVYLEFADLSAKQREQQAARLQFPPVVSLPVAWYANTKVTFDMGGYLGRDEAIADLDRARKPSYSLSSYRLKSKDAYLFGWNSFNLKQDLVRKQATGTAGGWPYRNARFLLSQNPQDYYDGLSFALSELNIRPEWLAGYRYDQDFSRLKPTSNPYAGDSWRRFDGHHKPVLDSPYLTGSQKIANPRDDQHAWSYHVEDAYYYTANPWIKDWYQFIGEFRKTRLHQKDPYPDMSSRALGHSLNQALAAYRITGDQSLVQLMRQYVQQHLMKRFEKPYLLNYVDRTTGRLTEASFQAGFLLHALINYVEEVGGDSQVEAIIDAYMQWNLNYANFSYYSLINAQQPTHSDGTGLSFVDPQIWYALKKQRPVFASHAKQYVNLGIPHPGGMKPYGHFHDWQGQYEGRLYQYYLKHIQDPPLSISASAVLEGDSSVLTLGLAKPAATPVKVQLTAKSGSAKAGLDFQEQLPLVTFESGESMKRIEMATWPDLDNQEGVESFTVDAKGPSGSQASTVVSITDRPYQVTIDNMDERSVAFETTWKPSVFSTGYYYTNYHMHAPDATAEPFEWWFSVAFTGDYALYARWTSGDNRSQSARYQVSTPAGNVTLYADQRRYNGQWVKLGELALQAGPLESVRLYPDATGYVVADAIELRPLHVDLASRTLNPFKNPDEDTSSRILVDNQDKDTQAIGAWVASNYTAGFINKNYQAHAPGSVSDSFTWTLTITKAGEYDVYAKWTAGANRATDARYAFEDQNGWHEVRLNQQKQHAKWVKLGRGQFGAGRYSVKLYANAQGHVVADAIMVKPKRD